MSLQNVHENRFCYTYITAQNCKAMSETNRSQVLIHRDTNDILSVDEVVFYYVKNTNHL